MFNCAYDPGLALFLAEGERTETAPASGSAYGIIVCAAVFGICLLSFSVLT